MDPSAPQTVLKGVAITSSLCGIAGGLYGGFKHGTPGKFLVYSGVNSGIVAATFFSIREYVVSPVLALTLPGRQYQLRRQRLSVPVMSHGPDSPSWADIRACRLLDSGISGGLAGAILNAWKRGRRGLTPGFTTGALTCTLLQWTFNEFNILRIHYVSVNLAGTLQSPADPAIVPVETSTSSSPMDHILSVFGKRLSDEKYLERLKMERDSYLRRIEELEEKKKQ